MRVFLSTLSVVLIFIFVSATNKPGDYLSRLFKLESTSNFYVTDGKSFEISCSRFKCKHDINIYLPNGEIAVTNDYINVVSNTTVKAQWCNKVLIIDKFNLTRDDGSYSCEIDDNSLDNKTKIERSVTYVDNPFMNVSAQNQIVDAVVGKDSNTVAKISVNYEANPLPKFEWIGNKDETIGSFVNGIEEDKFNKSQHDASLSAHTLELFFKNVDYDDSGNYTLIASSFGEEESVSIRLRVSGIPKFPDDYEFWVLKEGDSSTVNCTINAMPLANISLSFEPCVGSFHMWPSCNRGSLEEVELVQIDNLTKFSQNLKVRLQVKHPGFLHVNATNEHGTNNRAIAVKIGKNEKSLTKLHKDIFNGVMKRFEVLAGHVIMLVCAIPNYEPGSLAWFINGRKVKYGRDNNKKLRKSNTTYELVLELNVTNVKQEDSGLYECMLETTNQGASENTKSISQIRHLNITVINGKPAKVTPLSKRPKNESLEIECRVEGYPMPNILWYKNDEHFNWTIPEPIAFIKGSFLIISTLNISQTTDYGNYSCRAFNGIGAEHEALIIIKPKTKPYITIIVVVVSLIVIILLITLFVFKIQRDSRVIHEMKESALVSFEQGSMDLFSSTMDLSDQADILPYDRRFEFPREKLRFKERLGAGAFGIVVKAIAEGIHSYEEETVVAIKTVPKYAENEMIKVLILELKVMIHLGQHLNIVNLLGASTRDIAKRELLVICEYCPYGNLHTFLLNHRATFVNQIVNGEFRLLRNRTESDEPKPQASNYITVSSNLQNGVSLGEICKGSGLVTNTESLISWSFQIARGMEYLASRKVIHGDLAARNILLCEDNIVKICDFGLSKSLYKNYIYKRKEGTPLPYKWLALEAVADHVFSVHTDIWAYGILLWEIFSLGQCPYPGMQADHELFNKICEGYRMEKPEFATIAIHTIMLDCWHMVPTTRPSFTELERRFANMLEEPVRNYYVNLNEPYLKLNQTYFNKKKSEYLKPFKVKRETEDSDIKAETEF